MLHVVAAAVLVVAPDALTLLQRVLRHVEGHVALAFAVV